MTSPANKPYSKNYYQLMRRNLMSDAQFRPKNLKKKLLRLLEEERNWKPYRFDFSSEKNDSVKCDDRNRMVKLQGKICDKLGWSHDTKFSAMNLFDSILQTTKITKTHLDIFNAALLRLAAKLNEEAKMIPPSSVLLKMCGCGRGTVKDLNKMEILLMMRMNWSYKGPMILPILHHLYAMFCIHCASGSNHEGIPSILELTEDLWTVVMCGESRSIRPSLLAYSALITSITPLLLNKYHQYLNQLRILIMADTLEVEKTRNLIQVLYDRNCYVARSKIRNHMRPTRSIISARKARYNGRFRAVERKRLECIHEVEDDEEKMEVEEQLVENRPNKRKMLDQEGEENLLDLESSKLEKCSKVSRMCDIDEIYADIQSLYHIVDQALNTPHLLEEHIHLTNRTAYIQVPQETVFDNTSKMTETVEDQIASPNPNALKLTDALEDRIPSYSLNITKMTEVVDGRIGSPNPNALKLPEEVDGRIPSYTFKMTDAVEGRIVSSIPTNVPKSSSHPLPKETPTSLTNNCAKLDKMTTEIKNGDYFNDKEIALPTESDVNMYIMDESTMPINNPKDQLLHISYSVLDSESQKCKKIMADNVNNVSNLLNNSNFNVVNVNSVIFDKSLKCSQLNNPSVKVEEIECQGNIFSNNIKDKIQLDDFGTNTDILSDQNRLDVQRNIDDESLNINKDRYMMKFNSTHQLNSVVNEIDMTKENNVQDSSNFCNDNDITELKMDVPLENCTDFQQVKNVYPKNHQTVLKEVNASKILVTNNARLQNLVTTHNNEDGWNDRTKNYASLENKLGIIEENSIESHTIKEKSFLKDINRRNTENDDWEDSCKPNGPKLEDKTSFIEFKFGKNSNIIVFDHTTDEKTKSKSLKPKLLTISKNNIENEEPDNKILLEKETNRLRGNKTKFKAKNSFKSGLPIKVACKIQLIPHNNCLKPNDLDLVEDGEIYVSKLEKIKNEIVTFDMTTENLNDFPSIHGANKKGSNDKISGEVKPLTYAQVLRLHMSPAPKKMFSSY